MSTCGPHPVFGEGGGGWGAAKRVNPVFCSVIWANLTPGCGEAGIAAQLHNADVSYFLFTGTRYRGQQRRLRPFCLEYVRESKDKRFESRKMFSQTVQLFVSTWAIFLWVFFSWHAASWQDIYFWSGLVCFEVGLSDGLQKRLLAWLHWNMMQKSSQGQAMANWTLKLVQITDRRTI